LHLVAGHVRFELSGAGCATAEGGRVEDEPEQRHIAARVQKQLGAAESEVDGTGDGDTTGDIVITDNYTFSVRVERKGNGNGRVYGVRFEVSDSFAAAGTPARVSLGTTAFAVELGGRM
jgi:hypothetical protein